MKISKNASGARQSHLIGGCFVLALALISVVASPVRAEGRDGHAQAEHARQNPGHHALRQDRNWNNHESHARRYWNQPSIEPEPSVVYAPPLIYAPPPVYAEPGISLVFPLRIR